MLFFLNTKRISCLTKSAQVASCTPFRTPYKSLLRHYSNHTQIPPERFGGNNRCLIKISQVTHTSVKHTCARGFLQDKQLFKINSRMSVTTQQAQTRAT